MVRKLKAIQRYLFAYFYFVLLRKINFMELELMKNREILINIISKLNQTPTKSELNEYN